MKIVNQLFTKISVLLLAGFLCSNVAFSQYYHLDIKRDSARSDKVTGGVIEKTEFASAENDIRITVNVPAFQMTFWQNGKEVENYPVGVGMKDYPIYVGRREIQHIIFNPVWIPPDSEWVAVSQRGKIILPTDPANPLGKVKIPLGYGYLLHEAKGWQDMGNLVSHGCVRVLRKDLYDLSSKIVAAHSLPVSDKDVADAKRTKKTFVIELEDTVPIEITYDTIVVEAGVLHIYPDVYDYNKNTVENLREELTANGIDNASVTDKMLSQLLDKAVIKKQYVISLKQLRAGNYLDGKVIPVVDFPKSK